jgi:hypothetical protein
MRHLLYSKIGGRWNETERVITTDASLEGWGAVYNDSKIGGRWNEIERVHHINYLELLAVFHAIKSFCKNHKNTYVGFRINNTCEIYRKINLTMIQ